MKKMIIVLSVLVLVGGGLLFAADPTLNVYGYIAPEAPSTLFSATETLTGAGIDLKGNTEVHYTGNGVKVGEWTLNTFNHLGSESYSVKYTFGTLSSASTSQNLNYVVLENDGTAGLSAALVTEDSGPAYLAPSGDTTKTRNVRVRLTEDSTTYVLDAPTAATDFTSTITLELVSNS